MTRHWLIPKHLRPKVYAPHPVMSADEIRQRTQGVWDEFYRLPLVWQRAKCVKSMKSRLAFVLISKLYRQMYANTGISTDSARSNKAHRMTRLMARPLVKLFAGAADAAAAGTCVTGTLQLTVEGSKLSCKLWLKSRD